VFAWCVSVSTAAVSHLCCPLLSHSEYLSMQLITYTWPLKVKVLGSQPAGDVSHKPSSRLPLLSTRPAVTLATRKRAATNVAAWWTEAWWVWTVCLRLLPDSVVAAIWTRALLCLSPAWPLCILNTLQHHQSRIKPRKSLTWKKSLKLGFVFGCTSSDMLADRQTDMLITILRSPTKGRVIILSTRLS